MDEKKNVPYCKLLTKSCTDTVAWFCDTAVAVCVPASTGSTLVSVVAE